MIEFTSNHYPSNKHSNLTFLKQNINEIDLENHFKKIVSFSILHWMLDQEKALKIIYQAYFQRKTRLTDTASSSQKGEILYQTLNLEATCIK